MYSVLLAIIYIAFISLGLPDSLLGSAWPVMQGQLNVPLSYAGIVSMIIAGGTIVSSLLSDRLTKRLGAGMVTAISVLMTAVALLGFSTSNSFLLLCLWGIPYGLGAGAVDAALNNYVALHYASRHMSWLHCFWGVGAAISPYIMSYCLTSGKGWHSGYGFIGILQIALTAILFISLPLWKNRNNEKSLQKTGDLLAKSEKACENEASIEIEKITKSEELDKFEGIDKLEKHDKTEKTAKSSAMPLSEILKIDGVKLVLLTFFGYCALETTTGLWASSYLTVFKSVEPQIAARFASLFFIGITVGRFLCGFVAEKVGDRRLIKIGILTMVVGIILVALPIEIKSAALFGLIVIGFGCAPVYPSVIHSTPVNFGADKSQAIIGVQMASAYAGSTFMPPIFGIIARHISIGFYPMFLAVFAVLMFVCSEKLNKKIDVKTESK